MPASTRQHTVAAAIVGCLFTSVPPSAPAAAAPDHPPAAARAPAPAARGAILRAADAPVTIAMASTETVPPTYQIEVRNNSDKTIDTTVRQELPPGTTPAAISEGGQAGTPGGQSGAEVTWRLQLAAQSTTTLRTTLALPLAEVDLAAPACAYAGNGDLPYDCATAIWDGAKAAAASRRATDTAVKAGQPADPPSPRLAWVIISGLAALALLAGAGTGLWWARVRRRRSAERVTALVEAEATAPTGGRGDRLPGAGAAGGPRPGWRLAMKPRPSAPKPPRRRGRPPIWAVAGLAVTLIVGLVTAAAWTTSARVAKLDGQRQPSSGAWVGRTAVGPLGAALRDVAFEFTVYRLACPAEAQRCQAVVGVRNVTDRSQLWYGTLQRAYLPDGNWVSADEGATQTVNAGRNLFADPVPPGARLVFPLVFTTRGDAPPTRIELRSAVFSAGVSVDVP